jgi:hypothetical protein
MKQVTFLLLTLLFFSISSCSKDDDNSNEPLDFSGSWSGTFTGDVSGTWTATISEGGIVTGTAMVTSPAIQSRLNGNVSSDGKFTATVGTTSLGYNFDGKLNSKSGSGTWENSSKTENGTWSGKKE